MYSVNLTLGLAEYQVPYCIYAIKILKNTKLILDYQGGPSDQSNIIQNLQISSYYRFHIPRTRTGKALGHSEGIIINYDHHLGLAGHALGI